VRRLSPQVVAWLRLARVYHRTLRAMAEALAAWGLTPAQFDVLAQVGAAEGRSQQALADALVTTKGNLCQLLDRLEAAGLLRRVGAGRVNRLYLTPAGRRLWSEVVPAHEAWIADRLRALSAEELAALLRALRRLDRG
jgi:DNA-binding MarR family transcriptional regulator